MKIKYIVSGLFGLSLFLLSTSVTKAESYNPEVAPLDINLNSENQNSNWQQSSNLLNNNYNKFNKFNSLELASETSFNSFLTPQTPGLFNTKSTSTKSNDYQTNAGALGIEPIIPDTYLVQSTNVSQMRDVAPRDWAYEALRSLVDNYSCIGGFPDQTFRGEQALSRYEFAAGLNSCLQQIERAIAGQESVSEDDLQTIARLNQEFAAELQSLQGRVDELDSRIAVLEDNQFSTTTILNGEVIFALADAFGGNPPGGCNTLDLNLQNGQTSNVVNCGIRDGDTPVSTADDPDSSTVLTYLARLGFQSSFSGQDRLRMFLTTGNFDNGGFTNPESFNTYAPRLSYQAGLENQVVLDILEYRIPAFNDRVAFYASTFGFSLSNVLTSNSPYFDIGRGAVSRFGQLNSIYRIGGAMDAGVGFDWLIAEPVRLQVAYGTRDSADPEKGFFGADHSALGAQLLLQPTESIVTGITYVNAYSSDGSLGTYTGSVNAETNGLWSGGRLPVDGGDAFPGAGVEIGDLPAQINAVGGTFQWNLTENLNLGASGAYTFTNFLEDIPEFGLQDIFPGLVGKEPYGNTVTYQFSLGIPDPFNREGDLFGFIFGMPPKLVDAGPVTPGQSVPFSEQVINNEDEVSVTDNDSRAFLREDPDSGDPNNGNLRPEGTAEQFGREDEATSLHFEFFYRYTVNDHISITPGFFFVTNPGHIKDNDTLYVGTIRTTFRF